jgi:hypothetical protein
MKGQDIRRAKFETFHWTPGITAAARFSAGAAKTEAARALRKRIGVVSILLDWLLLLKVVRWLEQSYLLAVMKGRIERQFEGERYFVLLYRSLDMLSNPSDQAIVIRPSSYRVIVQVSICSSNTTSHDHLLPSPHLSYPSEPYNTILYPPLHTILTP